MDKYILYDKNTDTTGFYIEGVHSEIPEAAKLITDDAYDFFLENNGLYTIDAAKYKNAKVITKDMFTKVESQIIKESVSDL